MSVFRLPLCAIALVIGLMAVGQANSADRSSRAERSGTIAFEAKDGLYVVEAGGGQARRIPGTGPGDGDPRWSPDGTQLAFDRDRGSGTRDIFVMSADGSEQRRLTFSPADDGWPEWAPNGRSLAFVSERDSDRAVYAINVATGAARRVAMYGQFPDWTSDGRIIFAGLLAHGDAGLIFTVRPYGADRRLLPVQPGNALGIRVSDDGQKIVYSTRAYDIRTASIDGTQSRRLVTSDGLAADDPAWSPDGEWVAYDVGAARPSRQFSDVYVIRADGTGKTRLATLRSACCPDWRVAADEQ